METNLSHVAKKAKLAAGNDPYNSYMQMKFNQCMEHISDRGFNRQGYSCQKLYQPLFFDWINAVNDNPTFYVHAPVRTDPGAAPAGHDTLSVIVGAGHVDAKKDQDWKTLKEKTRDAVIRRLERHGLSDLSEHIKFEICYTPETWEGACNIQRGSVFGSLSHSIMQMGYFRPHNRHDKYHNLYFVGGSTHPGNGIPNVLMSAKLVAERIFSGK